MENCAEETLITTVETENGGDQWEQTDDEAKESRRGQRGEEDQHLIDQTRHATDGQPQDGRHVVRRHGRIHRDVHTCVPHGAGPSPVQHDRILHVLREQRRQPGHLFVHEQELPRGHEAPPVPLTSIDERWK